MARNTGSRTEVQKLLIILVGITVLARGVGETGYSSFEIRSRRRNQIMRRDYGCCPRCGEPLYPVWFEEEEFVEGKFTGRVRWAVSHLLCKECLQFVNVDDSFDLQWREKRNAYRS
jgi:hypothetical protein